MLTLPEVQLWQIQVICAQRFKRTLKDLWAQWPLQSYQSPAIEDLPVYLPKVLVCRDLFGEVGQVFLPASGVGNEVESLWTETRNDGVVDYAACNWVKEA